jgi:hypothetical protein
MSEIREMDDADYFALPALDQSALKRFMVSPLAYADYVEHGLDVSKAALDFGSVMHSLVLGRGVDFAVKPNLRTKEGKAEAELYKASGVIMLSQADADKALEMAPMCRDYIQSIPGKPEMALLATDPVTGLELKGKADWLPENPDSDGVYRIRDYKTTSHDPREFPNTAFQFGYHLQAAFYMRLAALCGLPEPFGFEFVVQEKQSPYDWMVWRFDSTAPEIGLANQRIEKALLSFAEIKDAYGDDWASEYKAGYDKTPQNIEFPVWALEKESEEVESWR